MTRAEVQAMVVELIAEVRHDLLEDIANQPANRDVLLAQLDVLAKLGDKLSGQL